MVQYLATIKLAIQACAVACISRLNLANGLIIQGKLKLIITFLQLSAAAALLVQSPHPGGGERGRGMAYLA